MPGTRTAPDIPAGWTGQLATGLRSLGVGLDGDRQVRMLRYLALLRHWNRAFNLTAIRDPAQMVSRHLLDSLSIVDRVDEGPVLDVGSGAGLPGIPLAIARPGLAFVLLDSNGKKTRFLCQAVAELGLANVEVVQHRVERFERPAGFRRIVARAFAGLGDLVAVTDRLLAADGRWLAMKGADPAAEIAALPGGLGAHVVRLRVPGEPARRSLVIVERRPAGRARPVSGPAPAR